MVFMDNILSHSENTMIVHFIQVLAQSSRQFPTSFINSYRFLGLSLKSSSIPKKQLLGKHPVPDATEKDLLLEMHSFPAWSQ